MSTRSIASGAVGQGRGRTPRGLSAEEATVILRRFSWGEIPPQRNEGEHKAGIAWSETCERLNGTSPLDCEGDALSRDESRS